MTYIIASTGRAGSTAVARVIAESLPVKGMPIIMEYPDFCKHDGHAVKTHLHFKEELKCEYRAVYVYCNIGDCISSLVRMPYGFCKFHLKNLEVNKKHLDVFLKILRLPLPSKVKKFFAYYYIIKNDKLRFMENFKSWKKSKHTLFVKLENLISDKNGTMNKISQHLGVPLADFEVKKRLWYKKDLPYVLRRLIDKTYTEPEWS